MRFLLLAAVIAAAYAQTTRYPGAIDSDSSLFVVSDNVQTTLNAAMSTGDTAAVVASSTGFAPNMVATICDTQTNTGKCTAWEHMLVTAVAGNILTVTRGFAGTVPRTHASGRLVSILIDSVHQKVLKDAVVAMETALGTNLSNISLSPVVNGGSYNFSAYSCNSSAACSPGGPSGMSLIAGNNTLTMTPVPMGVNGSDLNHYLYVSGGTGAADACKITGGSGTSGAASGTVIVQCANTHSGAWTIRSASTGIREAISIGGTGATVVIPAGVYTLYAQLVVPSNFILAGSGGKTVLQVPANAWASNTSGPYFNTDAGTNVTINTVNNAVNVVLRDFILDMNGGAGQDPAFHGTVLGLMNASNSTIERVQVINVRNQGRAIATLGSGGGNIRILNNTVIGYGGIVATCVGGIFVQGPNTFVGYNSTSNLCDEAYIANGAGAMDSTFVGNLHIGNASSPTTAFHAEGSSGTLFLANTVRGRVAACFNITPTGIADQKDIEVSDNLCDPDASGNAEIGVQIGSDGGFSVIGTIVKGNMIRGGSIAGIVVGGTPVSRTIISKNLVRGANVGILLQPTNVNTSVVDNIVYGNTGTNIVTTNATNFFIGPNITDDANNQKSRLFGAGNFATLPACTGFIVGMMAAIGDSSTSVWGAVITGGGLNNVAAYCDGSAWTVMGK